MARKLIHTVSDTVVCPKCGRKTHGTWKRSNKERCCIHCGNEWTIGGEAVSTKKTTTKKTTKKESPTSLVRIPKRERDRILEQAADAVVHDYDEGGSLTDWEGLSTPKAKTTKKAAAKKKTTKKKAAAKKTTKRTGKRAYTLRAKKATKKAAGKLKSRVPSKAKTRGRKSKPEEGVFSDTPMGLMRKLIMEQRYTDDEIWSRVKKKYPKLSDTKRGSLSWVRFDLRKKGHDIPRITKG